MAGRLRLRGAAVAVLAAASLLGSCASGGGSGGAGAGGRQAPQTEGEIAEIMRGLKPTERFVANADTRLLWQAASGYMDRAFPLDELPAGAAEGPGGTRQIRSKLVEWIGDGLPHRTRVFLEMRPDPANPANARLRVVALMIEAQPDLEAATEGRPIPYEWRLLGSNQRVEETVIEQIMRRYLALQEGKPLPLDDELVVPVRET
jgi:hypothetical protein